MVQAAEGLAKPAATSRPLTTPGDYNAGHATAQPTKAPIEPHKPVPIEDAAWVNGGTGLGADEIAHFRRHGYLVKRRLIDEPGAFRETQDHLWRHVPRGILERDDPATWLDDPDARWTEQDALRVGMLARGGPKDALPTRDGIARNRSWSGIANSPARSNSRGAPAPLGPTDPARAARFRAASYARVFPKPGRAAALGATRRLQAAQLSAMVLGARHAAPLRRLTI